MNILELLVLLAVCEAAGILVLAVLLFRKKPTCHLIAQEKWRADELRLLRAIKLLKRELAAARQTEASLRAISRQQE